MDFTLDFAGLPLDSSVAAPGKSGDFGLIYRQDGSVKFFTDERAFYAESQAFYFNTAVPRFALLQRLRTASSLIASSRKSKSCENESSHESDEAVQIKAIREVLADAQAFQDTCASSGGELAGWVDEQVVRDAYNATNVRMRNIFATSANFRTLGGLVQELDNKSNEKTLSSAANGVDYNAFTRWVEQKKGYKLFVRDNSCENSIANEIRITGTHGIVEDFFIWTNDQIFNTAPGGGKGRDYSKNVKL